MAMKRWATAARVAREGGQSHQALHLIMVCFGIQGVRQPGHNASSLFVVEFQTDLGQFTLAVGIRGLELVIDAQGTGGLFQFS
jgi:hypothetical protein